MNQYIPEIYKNVIETLNSMIEKHKLDEITVESLVRSSIEIEDPVMELVTQLRRLNGKTYSIKLSNIKVNLKFALSAIFQLKTIVSERECWLVLAIIQMIVNLFAETVREVDEVSSIVLISVFRLDHGTEDRVCRYAREICPPSLKDKLTLDSIRESLKKLEELGCITCMDGMYIVLETVTSSMKK